MRKIRNDERREVARQLRDTAEGFRPMGLDVIDHRIVAAIDNAMFDRYRETPSDLLRDLADLIEPAPERIGVACPSETFGSFFACPRFNCSECGGALEWELAHADDPEVKTEAVVKYPYCPHCGAKLVELEEYVRNIEKDGD